MPIHLYAEHLVHIRALSIQVALPSASNQHTTATLSPDANTLTLEHDCATASIRLPVQVPHGGNRHHATLTIPPTPTHHLTFRLSLPEQPPSAALGENLVPWTAHTLAAETEVQCVHCHSIVLPRHGVQVWKNLPSENWAEMMDFWHCHRPHVPRSHHHHHHQAPVKGYSADSTLATLSGVGLVDAVDLVLAPADCTSLKLSSSSSTTSPTTHPLLSCSTCDAVIGHVHTSGGYKLRKQHLALSSSPAHSAASFPPAKWFACQLLAAVDTQGVRKFTVQSTDASGTALKLWIFTPDLDVSSSVASHREPMRAMKVFWQECPWSSQHVGPLNRQAVVEGELELPPQELQQLREKLVESVSLLPETARKFQDWEVALLPRFEEGDVEHGR